MRLPLIAISTAVLVLISPLLGCTQDSSGAPGVQSAANSELQQGKAALLEQIAEYDEAMFAGDYAKTVRLGMPPHLLAVLAESEGIPADKANELLPALEREIETVMSRVTITKYEMDKEDVPVLTTNTGREYALIPTRMEMKIESQNIHSTGHTLALVDEGRWFLLNPADAESVALFKTAFPDLEPITIPVNKIEFR